jgi:hypothetical protein
MQRASVTYLFQLPIWVAYFLFNGGRVVPRARRGTYRDHISGVCLLLLVSIRRRRRVCLHRLVKTRRLLDQRIRLETNKQMTKPNFPLRPQPTVVRR